MNKKANLPSSADGAHRYHLDLVLFGLFCLVLPALFIWLHIVTPSDGARLTNGTQVYTQDGVVISPYDEKESLLRDGDVVTAIEGVPLSTWAGGLFRPGPNHLRLQLGQSIDYTILRDGRSIELEIPLRSLPLAAILRDHWSVIVFFLLSQIVAGFVYFRRHEDPAARAFFIWAFSGSHTYSWAFFLQISDLINPAGFWLFHLAATGLWMVFWAAVVHMVLMFPKPLILFSHPRRWAILLYLSPFVIFGLYLTWQWLGDPNLLVWLDRWGTIQALVAAIYTLPALFLVVIQYRTSRSEIERIKTRWVIFGTLISLGLGLALYFIPSLLGKSLINANILGLINFPFIITMGIAIWRYRLFDIDLIIRRTLQYSLLTGLLSSLYFGGVALMQSLLTTEETTVGGLMSPGSSRPPAIVIVLTTLLIAALFNPLRLRIQDFIDRRFYRQKYDAEKALAEFAEAARSETDLEQLSVYLNHTVQETLQPSQLILWLLEPQVKTKLVEE